MKKISIKHFIWGALLFLESQVSAQVISLPEAYDRAREFFNEKAITGKRSISRQEPRLLWTVTDTLQLTQETNSARLKGIPLSSDPLLYVMAPKSGTGYVILAGDDRASSVLGYSKEGSFSTDRLPDNMREWLKGYAREITYARKAPVSTPKDTPSFYDESWTEIPSMVTAQWNQLEPYNLYCPVTDRGITCPTGCGATALAQIVNYHHYAALPNQPESWFSGNSYEEGYLMKNVTVNFSQPIDWARLRDTYNPGEYTEEEAAAVARLMLYCGAATHMWYGENGSGVIFDSIHYYIPKIMGYDSRIYQTWREYYGTHEWNVMVYNELKEERPILYGSSGGGHFFVCDGYAGKGYFHFNFGWGGMADGVFLLQAILSDTPNNMSFRQNAVFNLCPPTDKILSDYPWVLNGFTPEPGTNLSLILNLTLKNQGLLPRTGKLYVNMQNTENKHIYYKQLPQTVTMDPNHSNESIVITVPDSLTDGTYLISFSLVENEVEQPIRTAARLNNIYFKKTGNQIEKWFAAPSKVNIDFNCTNLYKRTVNKVEVETDNPTLTEIEGDLLVLLLGSKDQIDTIQNVPSRTEIGKTRQTAYLLLPDSISKDTVQLAFSLVCNEIELGRSEFKNVCIRKESPNLVLTQLPNLPDTLYCGQEYDFSVKVQNKGEASYEGTIHLFFKDLLDEKVFFTDKMYDGTIDVKEEKELSFSQSFTRPTRYRITYLQNDTWPLMDGSGNMYSKEIVITAPPLGITEVPSDGKPSVEWIGNTACIIAGASVYSYSVIDTQGRTYIHKKMQTSQRTK